MPLKENAKIGPLFRLNKMDHKIIINVNKIIYSLIIIFNAIIKSSPNNQEFNIKEAIKCQKSKTIY